MPPELASLLAQVKARVDARLNQALADYAGPGARLASAMAYSLSNGGKRVRPLLVFAAAQALADTEPDGLDWVAAALESVHAYSLVHDDLPAMDDDELRRGRPTLHIAFDEATAILAGDALQALAFELLAQAPLAADTRIALVATLARAAGARGMVLGQAIDLASVNQRLALDQLQTMHRLKTGALIQASVRMGALAAGYADPGALARLDDYAAAIGLAFQVQDDILDVTADTATLGKPQGSDAAHNKPTYVSLLGLEQARAKAAELHRQALAALAGFDARADALRQLADYLVARQN